MTTDIAKTGSASRPSRSNRFRLAATVIVLLGGLNATLYVAAPDLYTVDLAKGPYTDANNLELTRVYNRAIPLYERIAGEFPDSKYATLSRIGTARSNVGLGRNDEAIAQYEALLGQEPAAPFIDDVKYSILAELANLYRGASNDEAYDRVFAQLEAEYPDSDAVKEQAAYRASRQGDPASSEAVALPADFPFAIDKDAVTLPETVKVGDTIEVRIAVSPTNGPTPQFSLMTDLGFWQGFSIERITPTPNSVAEFWGRRQWQFAGIGAPTTIVATLKAQKPGSYTFDLDIESNYDITEIGVSRNVEVEAQ